MPHKRIGGWLLATALVFAAAFCLQRPVTDWLTRTWWTAGAEHPLSLLEDTVLVGGWHETELRPAPAMSSIPFQITQDSPVTSIESITVENTSSAPLHDIWFFRKDAPNFHDTLALVQSVTAGKRTETEKVLALWGLFPKYYYNYNPAESTGPLLDPPTLLAVFGTAQCNYAAKVLSSLCQLAGCETHIIGIEYSSGRGEIAHCAMEVKADGKWIFMDPDGHAVYRRADGGWASAADLIRDSSPVRSTPHAYFDTALYAEAFRKGAVTFYDDDIQNGLDLAKRQTDPASFSTFRHLMRYDLLPGASTTLYPGRMEHTILPGQPLYCNGELRWSYRPEDFADGECRGMLAENLDVSTREGALVLSPHEAHKAAALVLPFTCPYLIVGAQVAGVIELPDQSGSGDAPRRPFRVGGFITTSGESSNREVQLYALPYITPPHPTAYGWISIASAAGAFRTSFSELFRNAPHFGFAVKLQIPPSGAVIRSLKIVAELQAAPRALPYLTKGDNRMILYSEIPITPLSIEASTCRDKSILFSNGLKITFVPTKQNDPLVGPAMPPHGPESRAAQPLSACLRAD